MEQSTIQQLWELFVQAECCSYEKSTWFDLFLAEFILQLNNGKQVSDILTFCNTSGVGTLIGCELLSDVHQVCSQPGDSEDLGPLRSHLLKGRGWRALMVLLVLGQQNLSCSKELANLLISLYPICSEARYQASRPHSENVYLKLNTGDEVDVFTAKTTLKRKVSLVYGAQQRSEFYRSHSVPSTSRQRRSVYRSSEPQQKISDEVDSSESIDQAEDGDVYNKSCLTLKIKLDPMDFDYFTNVVRSDDEARLSSVSYEPARRPKNHKKITPNDFTHDKLTQIMKSEVSCYEFSILVIQLLLSLSKTELNSISSENTSHVSSNCVKFALENLCSLQFGTVPTEGLTEYEIANLKSSLTQLLLESLDKVLANADVTTSAIMTGILPMMIKVLEDAVCKNKINWYTDDGKSESEVELDSPLNNKIHQFIFGMLCSVIIFLHSLLIQKSDLDKVRDFIELFQLFTECHGGKLMDKTLSAIINFKFINSNVVNTRARKTIDLIGQLISSLKKIRKDLVHPHLCKKSKHKKCKHVNVDKHHHHDLFGNVFNTTLVSSNCQPNCCVSTLYMILVRLIKTPDKIPTEILNKILKMMTACGTCCCCPTKNLMNALINIIKTGNQKTRSLVFTLLENTIYPELGAITSTTSKIVCFICNKNSWYQATSDENLPKKFVEEKLLETLVKRNLTRDLSSDRFSVKSESYMSDGSVYDGVKTVNHLWSKLETFRELMLLPDVNIVNSVVTHLLKISPKVNFNLKHIILFKIFYPLFLTSKSQYLSDNNTDDIIVFRILSSLSVFSSLLDNFTFAEQFLAQRGLHHILELIPYPVFSKHCCCVLEITIIIEIVKLNSENDVEKDNVDNLPSLVTLTNAVKTATLKFFKFFPELTHSEELHLPNVPKITEMGTKRRVTRVEGKDDSALELLSNVNVFWKTYSSLSLRCPTLRKYLSDCSILADAQVLLNIALKYLINESTSGKSNRANTLPSEYSENYLYTKLIESILTLVLATSTDSQDPSQRDIFISKLSESLLKNDLKNVDFRRLSEVLLKCSIVQPTKSQVLPGNARPKVPMIPLWSIWSEDEQDEDKIQTISDTSSLDDNYVTADEGYEADIEIKDTNTSFGDQNDTFSSCSLSDSVTQDYQHGQEHYKSGYNNIIHPKLCLLAIDLLIKIFENISSYLNNVKKKTKSRHVKSRSMSESFEKKSKEKNIENIRITKLKERHRGFSFSDKENNKSTTINDVKSEKVENWSKYLLSLISTIQRIVSLCKDNANNCIVLCNSNVIMKLIVGFKKCLSVKNIEYCELQRVLLDLITVLARHSITPLELKVYLEFFKKENPPMDLLLTPLSSLLTCVSPQPNYILHFPVVSTSDVSHKLNNDVNDVVWSIHRIHKDKGIKSPWRLSALALPISSEHNWSMWVHGFSISTWLRVERSDVAMTTTDKTSTAHVRPKTPQKLHVTPTPTLHSRKVSKAESQVSGASYCTMSEWGVVSDVNQTDDYNASSVKHTTHRPNQFHLFSIGNDSLLLECWTSTCNDSVTFKLSRVDNVKESYDVLCETIVDNCLSSANWHHFSVSVKDCIQRKKQFIEVTVLVDGWKEVKTRLMFNGLLIRKTRQVWMFLGHSYTVANDHDDVTKGSYCLSNVMLYRSPILNRERCLYVQGLGPNCTSLTKCLVGRKNPNFTSVFGPKTISCGVNWDLLFEEQNIYQSELQEQLLLVYSAHNPNFIQIYNTINVNNTSTLFSGLRQNVNDSQLTHRLPVSVTPLQLCVLNSQKYQGLMTSASVLGGSFTFLFLFARVVELDSTPEEQAKALYLLLKLVQSDSDLFSQFVSNDCHKLLRLVFSSTKCKSGLHILKAILDTCCDKPIIQCSGGKFHILQHSDAIIVNSFLLSTIVNSWKEWEDCTASVLGTLFHALHALLKDEHPYREFNALQLNRVHMVDTLMLFCKERLLYEEKSQVNREVCVSLVELVRSLMGAPPEFAHVVAVMDCLLLLHPASATYITHTRNSFYFLLSAGQNYRTHSASESSSEGKVHTSHSQSKSNDSVNKIIENWNTIKLNSEEFTQPVDASKLNKALTNLQIKQSTLDEVRHKLQSEEDEEEFGGDSNRYSDELCVDSGIAGSYRGNQENENEDTIVKAVDGSQQNLLSFFPSILTNQETLTEIVDEEKCTTDNVQKDNQNDKLNVGNVSSQCMIVEGLLLLLRDTILVLPDNMSERVLNDVVKMETLLVQANHTDAKVRAAVVKVLSSYLQRAGDEEINKFVKLKGFHHLANQISLYPASLELVESCLILVTRCGVTLEDQVEYIVHSGLSAFQLASFPPLLALLPKCVHDLPLTSNLLSLISHVYVMVPNASRSLLENGLLESLIKTLVASAYLPSEDVNTTGVLNQYSILHDIKRFLRIIAHQVNNHGIHNMQILRDMQLQLNYMCQLEKEKLGIRSQCVRIIRDALCSVVESSFDIIYEKISALQDSSTANKTNRQSFISSVLSNMNDDSLKKTGTSSRLAPASKTNSCTSTQSSSGLTQLNKELSRSELSERFKIIILNSVEFIMFTETIDGTYPLVSGTELNLVRHLFPLLLQALVSTLEKRSYGRRPACSAVFWACRDVLKNETAKLLTWLLCPRQCVKLRLFAVYTLKDEPKAKEVLSALLQIHPQIETKFVVFLWDLMYNNKLNGSDLRVCQELKESLQHWNIISPHAIGSSHDTWSDECNLLLHEFDKQMASWEKQTEAATIRNITKYDPIVRNMSEDAMTITRSVVEEQNCERKSLMRYIKFRYSENIQIKTKWSNIITQLTHENAVWHFENGYKRSWQLDPTEGPSRVRKRLTKCHLGIQEKFLMPAHKNKIKSEQYNEPLSYLFDKNQDGCTSSLLIDRLHCNEKIRCMSTAKVVTPATEVPGELLIGETCLYFVADDRHLSEISAGTLDASNTAWPFEDVKEIHNRRFQLQERALEIFLINGKTYLIAFQTSKERDSFVAELAECEMPNKVSCDNLSDCLQLWREGHLTNWDYLTQLNKMAGRSFNDLMQYPVFPFILADYVSQNIDLNNPGVFRNFKKPMAVQDKKNEQHYVNNYNYLKQELMEGAKATSLNQEPYHYGSHYSNSGTVLHFLVRLPPFTKMFLHYQDQNFDLPDRTFHSMQTTWRLTSCDSTTDVKELLPEFFFLPEFLKNLEGFNFGTRQNGERVDDVQLPPWCKNDARRFVLINRQALESDHVREFLPHWIDLVFGYKQTGKAAVEAINVFHPATYYGFDVESISDPLERLAWKTMVKTYGQTPRQLFRTPHPRVVQSLVAKPSSSRLVVDEVRGITWGSYVGSPAEPEPTVVWKTLNKTVVSCLLPLVNNDVFGLPTNSVSLLRYTKENGVSLVNATSVMGVALVTWGHTDNIVRVKLKRIQPLFHVSNLDPIYLCQSAPDCNQLWVGHYSGNISVYKYAFQPDKTLLDFSDEPILLQGHTGPVVTISINRCFSIVVSGGSDGKIIIWDLNHVSYVRCVELGSPVTSVCVSDTLGDIATVCECSVDNYKSKLHLHTINTSDIDSVYSEERIVSVCFSPAPEGVSVNVIACGLCNGVVRLWSSWNLTHVRDIYSSHHSPVISLTYSHDAQHLYASFADGTVVLWEGSGFRNVNKNPKFLNLTSL